RVRHPEPIQLAATGPEREPALHPLPPASFRDAVDRRRDRGRGDAGFEPCDEHAAVRPGEEGSAPAERDEVRAHLFGACRDGTLLDGSHSLRIPGWATIVRPPETHPFRTPFSQGISLHGRIMKFGRTLSLGLLALLSFSRTAWAGDDDWTLPDDDDEDDDKGSGSGSGSGSGATKTPAEGDVDTKKALEGNEGPDDDEIPMGNDVPPPVDFDDEEDEEHSEAQKPGEDTAAIYRAKLDEMKGWAADEEAME